MAEVGRFDVSSEWDGGGSGGSSDLEGVSLDSANVGVGEVILKTTIDQSEKNEDERSSIPFSSFIFFLYRVIGTWHESQI